MKTLIAIVLSLIALDLIVFVLVAVREIKSIKERDPAARNNLEVLLLYSGLHAIVRHRIAHFFYRHHLFFLARAISQHNRFLTGIEIHPGAKIGRGLFIDHGTGVVIGETTVIGDNCTIYQGVTLGGTGKDKGKRHPTLEHDVMVGAGAKVLGPVVIGAGSKVAAGAVVLTDVPENSTCVGVPARIVRINGKRPHFCDDLDQIHIPDPVSQELCKIYKRLDDLEQAHFRKE